MFTSPVYNKLKQLLSDIAPVFKFTGQYVKAKGNTSFIVPAIYVEMPKDTPVTYTGRGIKVMKPAVFKVHYISNAPFSQHDNTIQDAAINAHVAAVAVINKMMQGLVLKKQNGRLLTERFILTAASEEHYIDGHVISTYSYTTEVYCTGDVDVKKGSQNATIHFAHRKILLS